MTAGSRSGRRGVVGPAGAVLVAVLLGTLLYVAVPYLLFRTGLGTGYDAGLFRFGVAEYSKNFDLTDRPRTRIVAYAFGRRGETLRLSWDISIRSGAATLAVDEFLGGGVDPLWRERFTSRSRGDATVPLDATGLYQIRMSKTRWSGDARLRWSVGPPDRAERGEPHEGARGPGHGLARTAPP